MILETKNPQEANSIRLSRRGMLMLIQIDTLRRVHNVGFLEGRLNYELHLDRVRCMIKSDRL